MFLSFTPTSSWSSMDILLNKVYFNDRGYIRSHTYGSTKFSSEQSLFVTREILSGRIWFNQRIKEKYDSTKLSIRDGYSSVQSYLYQEELSSAKYDSTKLSPTKIHINKVWLGMHIHLIQSLFVAGEILFYQILFNQICEYLLQHFSPRSRRKRTPTEVGVWSENRLAWPDEKMQGVPGGKPPQL